MNRFIISILFLTVFWSVSIAANQNTYERRISEKLTERAKEGEVVWLNAGNIQYLCLFNEQLTDKAQGAAIIVHSMGSHPDWPEVIAPLRTRLPKMGWATLSIQMPVLAPEETLSEYGKTVKPGRARLASAIQYLRKEKFLNIVIIGHSFGAAIAAEFLANNKSSRVQAFVGISMQAQKFLNPTLKLSKNIGEIEIPILDIYGSRDFTEVIQQADGRKQAGRKQGRRNYQQVMIEGADHYFTDLDDIIAKRIRGWLDKAAPGVRVKAKEEIEEKIKEDSTELEEGE